MLKYSFIMPYYRRAAQFYNTLASLRYYYGDRSDWNVIVIEDSKNDDDLHAVISLHDDLPIEVIRTGREDKYNPAPAFNVGVDYADGEYVIITSPECMHLSNVLDVFDMVFEVHPDVYTVAACESGRKCKGVFTEPGSVAYDHHMWFQHSKDHNRRYHFCSSMKRDTYLRIGGFDERYADGYCFDDDAFRDRVEAEGIAFVVMDDALVLHQQHEKCSLPKPERLRLWKRNEALYEADKTRRLTTA